MEEEIKKIENELEEIKDEKERLQIQYILALRAEIQLKKRLSHLKK